ncbi:MAG: hypothetical protein KatS3mg107_1299 [Gemmataceae bacterium]|nr:MAG: hypothetical protein KatS3mg107_1299 [Gemmataceae bacterium]
MSYGKWLRTVCFSVLALVSLYAPGFSRAVAQSAPPSGVPVSPPPPGSAEARLDAHLQGWQKAMEGITNIFVTVTLKRSDPAATGVFKSDKEYKGELLCMKPNYARMRLVYVGDKTGQDYEAFICTGKEIYAYSGLDRTITEWKLPDPARQPNASTDNLMIDFLSGLKAENLKKRFLITLFNEDQYYIYLDIKPLLAKDKEEFKQLRLALYGPRTGSLAYLPAQAYIVKANDTIEQWTLANHKINIPGIDPQKVFRFEDVPGFTRRQAPQSPPPARPGPPTPAPSPQAPGGVSLPPTIRPTP